MYPLLRFRSATLPVLVLFASALLAAFAVSVARAEVITNVALPTNNVPVANPCSGSICVLVGDIHYVTRVTANENKTYFASSMNTQGVKMVDLVTGEQFSANNTEEQTLEISDPLPVVQTQTYSIEMLEPGKLNKFTMHITLHVTINANGTTTATVDNIVADCH